MPTILSGTRQARSMLSPSNAVLTQEIDFGVAARQGIEVLGVLGTIGIANITISATFASNRHGQQSVHLETGTLEDIPFDVAEDAYLSDTEVIFEQRLHTHHQSVGGAAGDGGSANSFVTPTGLIDLRGLGVYSARNLTHRAEASANIEVVFDVLIYYRYVEFSLGELGFILARTS